MKFTPSFIYSYSYGPDHLKCFWQDFKLISQNLAICPYFKWSGFKISDPIQNPDLLLTIQNLFASGIRIPTVLTQIKLFSGKSPLARLCFGWIFGSKICRIYSSLSQGGFSHSVQHFYRHNHLQVHRICSNVSQLRDIK